MNKYINKIFIARSCQMILEPTQVSEKAAVHEVATVTKNLEEFGYTISREVFDVVSQYSSDELVKFYSDIRPILKDITGAKRNFKPMYPNFPTQVMEASDAELYINAMLHYFGDWVGLRILPKYEKDIRSPLADKLELRVLGLGDFKIFTELFQNLMQAKTSISESDKDDLHFYLSQNEAVLPVQMYHKEIIGFVVGEVFDNPKFSRNDLCKYLKTATDVLRFAVKLSDGDVSLAEKTKFINFKRKDRKFLLKSLNECSNSAEDMLRYKAEWIRLGEKLHPGEYKTRFPKAFSSFDKIRNNKTIERFSTKVESGLVDKDVKSVVELLKSRPGEFARRLDHLIRLANKTQAKSVVTQFGKVAKDVSTPVLLQVKNHFMNRNDDKDLRVVMPRGNIAKIQALPNELENLDEDICKKITAACDKALIKHFTVLDELKSVYLDKSLKSYLVPFSQRSASKSMKTYVRGSKIDIPKGNTIRFFLWWRDMDKDDYNGRVDIDLSAVMYDAKWNYKNKISYTNLRSQAYTACHSGDITSAPNGACEFIDIDIPSFVNNNARFIVMNVLSYTRQPFNTMPECYAGWMIRQSPQSGEIFEPKTVQDKVDLTADTRICIPVVLDLVDRKVIWTDIALKNNPSFNINVEANNGGIALMGKAINEMTKPNLYDLFNLHVKARKGKLVKKIEDADTVFSVKEGVTPFDIEKIMNEYLV